VKSYLFFRRERIAAPPVKEKSMVAEVVILAQRRSVRATPADALTELTRALDELLKALELLRDAPQSVQSEAAEEAVRAACEILLAREKGMYAWTR